MIKSTRQDYLVMMWMFFQMLHWKNVSKRNGKCFSANIAMSCAKGEFLRLNKLLINMLWYSCALRMSWIYVRLILWIEKPLSTLLILIITTWVLVDLIWRRLTGFRFSATIAPRTPKKAIIVLERRCTMLFCDNSVSVLVDDV